MSFLVKLLVKLGLAPSERDKELKLLVDNSYSSLRVVGRGTVKIDPAEVRGTAAFREAREKVGSIVKP